MTIIDFMCEHPFAAFFIACVIGQVIISVTRAICGRPDPD